MNKCPSDFKLALFLEGKLPPDEASQVCTHASECEECRQVILDGTVLEALETGNALANLSGEEIHSVLQRLEKMTKRAKAGDGDAGRCPERNSSFKGFLKGVAAAFGISGLQREFGHLHPSAILSGKNEKKDDGPERSSPHQDSLITDGDKFPAPNSERSFEMSQQDLDGGPVINEADKNFGVPAQDTYSPNVEQSYQDTCAIRCQELILENYLQTDIPENTLIVEAMENGWYSPGCGTNITDVGNLLELHGLDVNRQYNANIFNLTNELARGHQVIVGVDANELWGDSVFESLKDSMGLEGANHALIVAGIDTSDPDNIEVILTDPGTGDVCRSYPMAEFMDAWQDSSCYMVSTATPPSQSMFLPEMRNFDYAAGHLSHIGEMPYEAFESVSQAYGEHAQSVTSPEEEKDLFIEAYKAVLSLVHGESTVESMALAVSDTGDQSFNYDDFGESLLSQIFLSIRLEHSPNQTDMDDSFEPYSPQSYNPFDDNIIEHFDDNNLNHDESLDDNDDI